MFDLQTAWESWNLAPSCMRCTTTRERMQKNSASNGENFWPSNPPQMLTETHGCGRPTPTNKKGLFHTITFRYLILAPFFFPKNTSTEDIFLFACCCRSTRRFQTPQNESWETTKAKGKRKPHQNQNPFHCNSFTKQLLWSHSQEQCPRSVLVYEDFLFFVFFLFSFIIFPL